MRLVGRVLDTPALNDESFVLPESKSPNSIETKLIHGQKFRIKTPRKKKSHSPKLGHPRWDSGRGSRELKVSGRGWPCHEFEPSTTKDSPCRGAMHFKSVESSIVLPLGYSKQLLSRKSSREVGGRGREMEGPRPPPGHSLSKLMSNPAKSYCNLYGGQNSGVPLNLYRDECHELRSDSVRQADAQGLGLLYQEKIVVCLALWIELGIEELH
ncbi:hypothetical protein TNCV_4190451 [Trichonephila clavipes]|nr:hypothetical protein TNCV_4190451 [Trichonephila clavipes]